MSNLKQYVETKEYVVTLKNSTDLENFYAEMESKILSAGNTKIPAREVACIEKRPLSRNTVYLLAEWETSELDLDPRVESVSLHPKYLGITAGELSNKTQTSDNWNKSSSVASNMLNFGLLRCTEGENRPNWGSNGTQNQTGTVKLGSTGKNVDVVIIDGNGLVIGHPEYTVNQDGTGGSRFIQYNWFQHDPAIKGTAAGNYSYSSTSDHATHVAATTAGNTQGWARDANIYNIFYFAGANNDLTFPYVMDYVREFHNSKNINQETGRKNPTITNNSWGMSIFPSAWSFNDITAVTYRGVRHTPVAGIVSYDGVSGVCTSDTRLAQLAGFENIGNRITTQGPYTPLGGSILSFPESWTLEGDQAYYIATGQPAQSSFELTVEGPTSISIINEIAGGAFSGTVTIGTEVIIRDGATVLETLTSGPFTSVDGGDVEASIRQTYNYAGSNILTIEFNSTVNTSSSTNPLVVIAMSLEVLNEADDQPVSASVIGIVNQLAGPLALTPSTTPTSGNNDDGFWDIPLPFNIQYLGNPYSNVFVGTNMYLTFGAGSVLYSGISVSSPNLPKIMWGAADNSVQRIYSGVENILNTATYTVTNSGASAYTINSSSNPTLNLKRGGTYTFEVNASGHPFWIKTAAVTGTGSDYSSGVTNNGAAVGTVTFTVPLDAPNTLYYICQFHSSMQGTINITNADRKFRIRIEGNASTGGTIGSPGMLCEYTFYEATPNQIDLQLGQTNRKSTSGGFTTGQLNEWGFVSGVRIPARVAPLDADIVDAIDDGVLFVGAAGNGSWKHDVPGGADWDNTFEMGNRYPDSVNNPYYYMKGSSPTANDISIPNISVGSIDVTTSDQKASYSDCGPGVDIYAPGTSIISADTNGSLDSRNNTFRLGKKSGTSMASPQVAGVLACELEQNPHWNQTQAKAYILSIAKENQITATTGGPADLRDLQGSENLYLYYKKSRPDTGVTIPNLAQGARPSTGQAWPRPKIYRFGPAP